MKGTKLYFFKIILIFSFLLVLAFFLSLESVFVLIFSPRVVNFSPSSNSQNIPLNPPLVITFDKPVKRQEIKFSIYPVALGEWRFEKSLINNHLFKRAVFIPAVNLEPNVQYQIVIKDIKGFGLQNNNSFQFSFKTSGANILEAEKAENTSRPHDQPQEVVKDSIPKATDMPLLGSASAALPKEEVTLLGIPLDWQDYPLSCEAASLKMALGFKGVAISEKEIMEKVGSDLTPRRGAVWTDPQKAFVGDLNGKMCQTGYGVYWEAVAKAAQSWRPSQSFTGWGIKDLTQEIKQGNPIIFWGVLPRSSLVDCSWFTLEGKYISAFKQTHVRLVVGFIGDENSPSKIIINDPLSGRIYWPTSYFLKNWGNFNYSGVVIR